MFQIWQDPDTHVGGLFGPVDQDQQDALASVGMELKLQIDTDDRAVAQQRFIEWCHEQDAGAKVERVSFAKLGSD